MSAIGQRTQQIRMGTTVTCPTFRYNPGVVAEAFASLSLLYPERIFLGIGSANTIKGGSSISTARRSCLACARPWRRPREVIENPQVKNA
jgi:alkanesulfonate monooxygenase SsuD/methylene tetrahydromethanopterin reductase-like flavin-dependent oxidoreductase (luciferase family)